MLYDINWTTDGGAFPGYTNLGESTTAAQDTFVYNLALLPLGAGLFRDHVVVEEFPALPLNSDVASLFSVDLQYEMLAFATGFFAFDQQYDMGLAFIEDMVDSMTMTDANDRFMEGGVNVADTATLSDTIDFVREAIPDVLVDAATLTDVLSVQAEFTQDVVDVITMNEVLDFQGQVYDAWVMNAETGAMSRYSWLPFTSLTEFNGRYFGTTTEGLYELTGDTDDGAAINAFVLSGVDELGSNNDKRILRAYVALKTSGEVLLKAITAENVVNIYRLSPATGTSNAMSHHRLPLGKGLHAVYWQFALENIDGADFELDVVKILPVVLQRRFR